MGDASAPRVKVEKGKGKMSREGTQGSSSDYFISGKLTANERFQHNFFDIKVKKEKGTKPSSAEKKTLNVRLFTSDLPPVPCEVTTKIKIEFCLEKIKSETDEFQTCFSIAAATFEGSMLNSDPSAKKRKNNFIIFTQGLFEWHFMILPTEEERERERKEREKREGGEKRDEDGKEKEKEKEKKEKKKGKEEENLILYFLSAKVPISKVKKYGHLL